MSLSDSASSAGKRACVCVCVCVCVFWRFKCHKLSCYFECIHSGDLHVILRKRAQPLNVYHRGTMAGLIEPCVPFVSVCVRACVRAYVWVPPNPPFPASHRKGLFGFIVQEGLCAQLAHLYKFSLYGVFLNTCTHACIHTHSSVWLLRICSHYIAIFPSTS